VLPPLAAEGTSAVEKIKLMLSFLQQNLAQQFLERKTVIQLLQYIKRCISQSGEKNVAAIA
jgi:hypothetical protein